MQIPKVQVLSLVLKQDKPFKAAKIHGSTGLGRELVRYHLTALVEQGMLIKDGMYYTIDDRDKLIEELADAGSNKVNGLLEKPNGWLGDKEKLNAYATKGVMLRSSKLDVGPAIVSRMNDGLSKAVEDLKGLRRHLNSKSEMQYKALMEIKNDFEEYWQMFGQQILDVGQSKEAFLKEIDRNIDKLEDESA